MRLKQAIQSLSRMALPIILGQVGQTLIGAGDVYIASKYSTSAVAAIGVANGIFHPILLLGIGLLTGVSPLLARRRGQKKRTRGFLKSIVYYSLFLSLALMSLLFVVSMWVPHFGIAPELVPSIQTYLRVIIWTIPLSLVFQGIKEYMQSFEDVMVPNLMSLTAVFFNVGLNHVLVFGYGDFAGLGEVGLPISSIIVRLILCLALFLYILPKMRWGEYSHTLNKNLFLFSYPIAFAFFLEVLAFAAVSIQSGLLGVTSAAANNIILVLGSTLFMIPLSLASASGVKVGNAYGREDLPEVKIFIRAALFMALVYSLVSSFVLAVFPEPLMRLFTTDQDVIYLGVGACYVAALFQIVDCSQATMSGLLRGLQETRKPFYIIALSFWLIGIPVGALLAFRYDWDIVGLWTGLAVGLTFAALGLGLQLKVTFQKFVASIAS